MNASLLAVLNDDERLLVVQTESAELARLDEDEAVELHDRIRSARNKYSGQYRRGASARVAEKGGRGKAEAGQRARRDEGRGIRGGPVAGQPPRRRAGTRVRGPAPERADRDAREARRNSGPARPGPESVPAQRNSSEVTGEPVGDRALRSPASEKRRGGTLAMGARRQAKRDSR
jgi:hypothetical protein